MRGQNYRQSLPGSTASSATPVTPMTRKRKREPMDSTPSSVRFHEESELDRFTGQLKSVIVIDDSPEPSSSLPASSNGLTNGNGFPAPPRALRTRAQVAAAHAALNGSTETPTVVAPPPLKRRRRDQFPAASGAALATRKPFPQITNKAWPSTSTDVVRSFYGRFRAFFDS